MSWTTSPSSGTKRLPAQVVAMPIDLVEPHPKLMLRFIYEIAALAALIKAAVDENTPNGQLEPGRVVPLMVGKKKGYLVYVGVRRYFALKWLYEKTHDARFAVFNAYVDVGLSELQMFVRAKMENEDEKGERQGLSVLEEVLGVYRIRDSVSPEKLDGGLKRLYEISGRLTEVKLKKLYDVERRTRSRFTLAQLDRLCAVKEDKDFYLAAASTSGFGFWGDDVEKAVEGRNAAYSLDWFKDVFPEYANGALPVPQQQQPDEGDGGEEEGHFEANEPAVILAPCPRCTAVNMVRVQGQIEAEHISPDPEEASMTVVAESVGRDDRECWKCGKEFYVFFRHLEGSRFAADTSPSKEFRYPTTIVETIDVRYDYGEKVWQKVVGGKIAGTVDLSGGNNGGGG